MNKVTIREVAVEHKPEWLQMRLALWKQLSPQVLDTEMEEIFSDPMGAVFLAVLESGGLYGFLEVGTRDHAEGCQTSPVGYIEAWHVDVEMRAGRASVRSWRVGPKHGHVSRDLLKWHPTPFWTIRGASAPI